MAHSIQRVHFWIPNLTLICYLYFPDLPALTLTCVIHIEFPLMLISLWLVKNGVSEVGQHSGWGPEATCMHPRDNNTPFPPLSSPLLCLITEGCILLS